MFRSVISLEGFLVSVTTAAATGVSVPVRRLACQSRPILPIHTGHSDSINFGHYRCGLDRLCVCVGGGGGGGKGWDHKDSE